MATRTDLGKWMITNGGEYDPDATYEALTMVMYDNSTYITLKTVSGVTPNNDGVDYQLMAKGFDATALDSVKATDTSGVLGPAGEQVSAQSLVDWIADQVTDKLVKKAMMSGIDVNDSNKIPTSAFVHTLVERIGMSIDLNSGSNLTMLANELSRSLGNYKLAPMDTYFPIADNTDNSLSLLQKMPNKSYGFFQLTGYNVRMGLPNVGGSAAYVFYRELGDYGSITAITKAGIQTRIWENGTLYDWAQSALSSSTYALLGGTPIPEGADLYDDAYKVPGNYYCNSSLVVKTLKNCPVASAFIMKVEHSTGTSYPSQTIREYLNGKTYYRSWSHEENNWRDDVSYVTDNGSNGIVVLPVQRWKDAEIGGFAKSFNIANHVTYITTNNPITVSDDNYVFGGMSYTLIGMEYGNHEYGYQFALSPVGIKYRALNANVWSSWDAIK